MFLALSIHLKAKLWTGDLELINGLKKKGFTDTITTKELFDIYLKRELSQK